MVSERTIESLANDVVSGNRRALSQAISLVESTNTTDEGQAAELFEHLAEHSSATRSRRIAISGAPGVGKSTLLEGLGLKLIDQGHRVAILAVDPTSKRTGGSILGDKVRMPKLSVHDAAYIRPSPSRRSLGGAAAATRDVMTLCEAAGYDTVIIETVGVGQSETDAADMVDLFLLLVMPLSGDDLQGIKRGIMEVADVVVITKADHSKDNTNISVAQHKAALQLMQPSRPGWTTPVVATSAVTEDGLRDLLHVIDAFFAEDRWPGIERVRIDQQLAWFDELSRKRILDVVFANESITKRLQQLRSKVHHRNIPPSVAVRELINHISVAITEKL